MTDIKRHKLAYSQPAGDLAGVQTFVNENNKDNLPATTSKPSKDNWRSRPDAPEHKEQALPVPPDHRPTRDNEKTNKTPGQPSYNTPPASNKQPEGKPLHQRMRTLDKPGDQYGSPYIEQGTLLNQRRTMTSATFTVPGGPLTPAVPQRRQVGDAKTKSSRRYKTNKGRILSLMKRRYRALKSNPRFRQRRKLYRKLPRRYNRRPGGYSTHAQRSQEWRDEQKLKKADFLREEVRPSDLPQTWRRKNDKGTPDGPNQRAEIPDGTTSWVDVGVNQRNPSAPAHQPQDYVVDNNPGSAKVIPEGHGFANRMASRVASRYLTATKIAEIEERTSATILQKARKLDPALIRVDAQNRVWLFNVQGSEPKPYRVRIRALPPQGNVKRMDKVDVQISCSCPFWQWQGPEHWASQNDYLYGKPKGTAASPVVKDPDSRHWMCKHVAAVLDKVKTYDVLQPKGKTATALWYLSSSLRLAGL